jgi:urease alpha subunit
LYISKYGPTLGDRIVLGDTSLIIEIERDLTVHGDELNCGLGQSFREAMGQAVGVRNDIALDSVLTNVVILDSVSGILKTDIGIRDGVIQGIGKAGNPNTMDITPDMIVGCGTDLISCEGLIATTGALDIAHCFSQTFHTLSSALSYGVTTVFGGGTGSSESSLTNCTPGPNHIKYMIQSTDDLALNIGFYAKANSSSSKSADSSSFDFPREVEDQIIAGAMGCEIYFYLSKIGF